MNRRRQKVLGDKQSSVTGNQLVWSSSADPRFLEFTRFCQFFNDLFKTPGFLAPVECRQSHKEYVPEYYQRLFGPGVHAITKRHLKWFHRLKLVLSLPRGSVLVDFGGGYGLDSVLLATMGYRVIFYELTNDHLAVCEFFKRCWEEAFGVVDLQMVTPEERNRRSRIQADALLMNEVAHHIEPPSEAFSQAFTMLRPGGSLYLLEPNYMNLAVQLFFLRVRGIKTIVRQTDARTGVEYLYGNEHIRPFSSWNRIAIENGLVPIQHHCVISAFLRGPSSLYSRWRRHAELLPVVRYALASHITLQYVRPSVGGEESSGG